MHSTKTLFCCCRRFCCCRLLVAPPDSLILGEREGLQVKERTEVGTGVVASTKMAVKRDGKKDKSEDMVDG